MNSQSTQESKSNYKEASGPTEQTYEDLKKTSKDIEMQENTTYTELNKTTQYETLDRRTQIVQTDNGVYCDLNAASSLED